MNHAIVIILDKYNKSVDDNAGGWRPAIYNQILISVC